MRMVRHFVTAAAVALSAGIRLAAAAEPEAAPPLPEPTPAIAVDLRVEQPAFLGLPLWFEVTTDDSCLDPAPRGTDSEMSYFGIDTTLELERDGITVPRNPLPWGFHGGAIEGLVPIDHACPEQQKLKTALARRFALHLAYQLQEPGKYRLRWTHHPRPDLRPGPTVIPPTDAQSDWVTFEVRPSTPAQREAWLAATLASPPTDPKELILSYIPALLAVPDELRVVNRLLDLVCSSNDGVAYFADGALFDPKQVALAPDARHHALELAQGGCAKSVAYFLQGSNDADGLTAVVHAVVEQLKTTDDARLMEAFGLLSELRSGRRWQQPSAALDDWMDAQVLAIAPEIIAADRYATSALAQYLWRAPMPPEMYRVIWQIADLPSAAREQALTIIINHADAADLPRLASIFAGPSPDLPYTRLSPMLRSIREKFSDAAIPMLQRVLSDSPYWDRRDMAALQLSALGDHPSDEFLARALQSDRAGEPGFIASYLGDYLKSKQTPEQAHAYFQQRVSRP